jgi:S-disulfanyl-L-cysteine oxidoreductase SoxD
MYRSIVVLLVFAIAFVQTAQAQTVLDGVFTAAQAERGKEAYAAHCASCHTDDLSGKSAPALKGDPFIENWREDSVKTLFTFIQTRMPNRAPRSLSDEMYIDILAHILEVNMYPAGSKELRTDVLDSIQLVGKDGPAPIPTFALITAVGCLSQSAEGEWMLENVSPPVRTREEKAAASELQASIKKPLGKDTFRLVYVDALRPAFAPEREIGKKMHARGYLLRNAKGVGLSVTWLEAVASSCKE